jgi:hypothetical protein
MNLLKFFYQNKGGRLSMGMESFYLNLQIDSVLAKVFKEKYESNEIFKVAFIYTIFDTSQGNEFKVTIEALIDNFLPSCMLIYQFLKIIEQEFGSFLIDSRGVTFTFAFKDRAQFIAFMYSNWESKIIGTYS